MGPTQTENHLQARYHPTQSSHADTRTCNRWHNISSVTEMVGHLAGLGAARRAET